MNRLRICLALIGCAALPAVSITTSADLNVLFPDPLSLRVDVPRSQEANPPTSILAVHSNIEKAYGVPVCFEWPYVRADRTSEPELELNFELGERESLAAALGELVDESKARLSMRRLHGAIVIQPPDSGGAQENSLDTRISVSVTNVSTWDAVKTVVREINVQSEIGRSLEVWPEFLTDGAVPAPGFADGESITLELANVSAREAICAIIHASPVAFSYTYTNYYRPNLFPSSKPISRLDLRFFKDGKPIRSEARMPRPELVRWMNEIEEVSRPAAKEN